MKTYPIVSQQGKMFAFEIENIYIRPKKIAKLLSNIDGIKNIELRKPFSKSPDTHLTFEYKNYQCMVWEPFGDSSRFWIGLIEGQDLDIREVEELFQHYHPPLPIQIAGKILSVFSF